MAKHGADAVAVFVSPDFEGCVAAVEMCEVVAGGAEAFQRRPFATCYINVTSGLVANAEALQKCMFLAEKGLPMLWIPLNAGGVNSPATTAASPKPADADPVPATTIASELTPSSPLPPNIRIGKITLQGGNVNFSDFFIRPNYSANLTGIGGSVTEMTPEIAADLELRGKVDNTAPVEIAGRLNPLAKDLLLDIKASARDIARAHGGDIWLEPTPIGSSIAFSLPLLPVTNKTPELS